MKSMIAALVVFSLMGCSSFERVYKGNCVSHSIFQAHVMEKNGYATRIVVMKTDDPLIYHAQAQAMMDGEWRWLDSDPAHVFAGERDMDTEIIEYMELDSMVKEGR